MSYSRKYRPHVHYTNSVGMYIVDASA